LGRGPIKKLLKGTGHAPKVARSLSQQQVCDAPKCSGPHARYTGEPNEYSYGSSSLNHHVSFSPSPPSLSGEKVTGRKGTRENKVEETWTEREFFLGNHLNALPDLSFVLSNLRTDSEIKKRPFSSSVDDGQRRQRIVFLKDVGEDERLHLSFFNTSPPPPKKKKRPPSLDTVIGIVDCKCLP